MPTYKIHDNGGTPFIVTVSGKHATVTATENGNEVYKTAFVRSWIGKHTRKYVEDSYYTGPGQLGNSILLQIDESTHVWIGWKILEFKLNKGEEVTGFDSPIGNNDVPYPAVFTNQRVLFMLDEKALPLELLDPKQDQYAQLYGFIGPAGLKKVAKKFRTKLLVKRQV